MEIRVTMLDPNEQRRNVVEYYRSAAEGYDAEYDVPYYKVLYDPITWRYIEPYLPTRGLVLDAGGGTGKWAIPIARKGLKVVVYDLSSEMLEVALRKAKAEGVEELVQDRQGDIREIGYPDEYFDFALAEGDPLSYCGDPGKAVSEIHRVLKPRCYAVAGVDSLYAQTLRVLRRLQDPDEALRVLRDGRFYAEQWGFQCSAFTPRGLRDLFASHGFQVVKVMGKPVLSALGGLEPLLKQAGKAERLLELELELCEEDNIIGLAGHLHIVARKPVT